MDDGINSKQPITEVINAGVKTLATITSLEDSIVSLLKIACNYYDSYSTSFILINENYISSQRKFEYINENYAPQDPEEQLREPIHITIDQSGSVKLATDSDDVPDDGMLIDRFFTKSFLVPVYSYAEFCGLLVVVNNEMGAPDFLKTTAVLIGEVLDKNADANHMATQQFFHSFESVYIVNLDTDIYRILHRRDWVWDAKGKEVQKYTPDVSLYIDTSVHEEDRKLVRQMLDAAYIKKTITKEKKSLAFPLRDTYTGKPAQLECRIIKADETEETHMVIITFRIADWEQRGLYRNGKSSAVNGDTSSDVFSYETIIPLRLSRLREQKGKSARDMSLSIGQNASYINNIENGKALPSMSAFFCICDYLDVTPMEFFRIDAEKPSLMAEVQEKMRRLTEEQLKSMSLLIEMLK